MKKLTLIFIASVILSGCYLGSRYCIYKYEPKIGQVWELCIKDPFGEGYCVTKKITAIKDGYIQYEQDGELYSDSASWFFLEGEGMTVKLIKDI